MTSSVTQVSRCPSHSLRWDWAIATPSLFAFSRFTLEYFGTPRSSLNDCKVPRSCCCTRSQRVSSVCKAKPCWYIFLGSFSQKQMQRCHICSMFFLLYYVEHLTWLTEACGVECSSEFCKSWNELAETRRQETAMNVFHLCLCHCGMTDLKLFGNPLMSLMGNNCFLGNCWCLFSMAVKIPDKRELQIHKLLKLFLF